MNHKPLIIAFALLALSSLTRAQSTDITLLVKQAQERSSLVKAAEAIIEARRANLSGSRSPLSPALEIAPGAGFTNSNTVLSQEFDLFGRRSAATQLAAVSLRASELDLQRAKADVSLEVLIGIARLLAAQGELEVANAAVESANALLTAVAKQHEIGEAPKVHVTRAELEVLRATQLRVQARGRLAASKAAVDSVLGIELETPTLAWPSAQQETASALSFDLLKAQIELDITVAQARVVRADFMPRFSVGVASDIWSLDRNAFRGDNFGFQLSFRTPIFDLGQRKGATRAADQETLAAQIRIEEAKRKANVKLVEALAGYEAAKAIAVNYEGDVLPKGESMLASMREGYAAGLVTLVEVLEAQQTVTKLKQEQVLATMNLRLAEIELWSAQLTLPGVEASR